MDWDSLLPSLPESPCNSQNAWEYPVQGESLYVHVLWSQSYSKYKPVIVCLTRC